MDKQKEIIEMFDDISKSYDLANRVLSLGIDISWRKSGCAKVFENIDKSSPIKIVDVACGTGDMIDIWQKSARKHRVSIDSIVGVDPSSGMLSVAREKLKSVEFIQGEAKELPFLDSSVDVISIAYGIRNVVERDLALKEFSRVLKKDGVVLILEFTKNENSGFLSKIVSFYTKKILPVVGGLVSRNYKAYKYLPDSIEDFLSSSMLFEELATHNLHKIYKKSYSGDISTLMIAKKFDKKGE